MVYYAVYQHTEKPNYLIETIAYSFEALGFVTMLWCYFGYVSILRQQKLMKVALCIYFAVELVLIILDFNIIDVQKFYNPSSKVLIIAHCIFATLVCLTYMELEPGRKPLQIIVSIASFIMMLGVFTTVYNVRVYASVLINSFSYIFLDIALLRLLKIEELEVSCHGDIAKVSTYKSSFFEEKN